MDFVFKMVQLCAEEEDAIVLSCHLAEAGAVRLMLFLDRFLLFCTDLVLIVC